ncbi:MAG: AAA family ATPase [Planctomycetes bacterium]|nr:AAA family ATPase [Planctomycetota bacterium]
MKINEIRIKRFGIWQNLSLSLGDSGLSVIYGPNEAGKSTLLRFIREVLYGFEPGNIESDEEDSGIAIRGGSLIIEHDDQCFEIVRSSQHNGLLRIHADDENDSVKKRLFQFLEETNAKLFNHVFAVGLQELQELATLHDEDVARHIYGLTLGPEGQTLIHTFAELERVKSRIFDVEQQSGELADLLAKDEQLTEEIESLKTLRTTHEELCRERDSVESEIQNLKERQSGIRWQLRGHQFLKKIWGSWNEVRELQQELDKDSTLQDFPENLLQRLNELEAKLDSAMQSRDSLGSEAGQLEIDVLKFQCDPEFQKYASSIENLLEQHDWISELFLKATTLESRAGKLKSQRDDAILELGEDWSLDRLEAFNPTPADHSRLIRAAGEFQSAQSKQTRLKNRYERISNSCQRALARLNEYKSRLQGLSIEEALSLTGERLRDLQELVRLRQQETDLQLRHSGRVEEIERLKNHMVIPKWVSRTLKILGLSGGVIAILGFVTGLMTNGITGILFAFSGLTGLGIAWGLKSHHHRETRDKLRGLRNLLKEIACRLSETRENISQLDMKQTHPLFRDSEDPSSTDGTRCSRQPSETEMIGQTVERLVELERWRENDRRIGIRRRRFTEFRYRLRQLQSKAGKAREKWCRELNRLGLPETLHVSDVFQTWQQIVVANDLRGEWQSLATELQTSQRIYEYFRNRILKIDHFIRAAGNNSDSATNGTDNPLDILNRWKQELKRFQQEQTEWDRLNQKLQRCREESAEIQQRLDDLNERYSALLEQGGTNNREEFLNRVELASEYRELEELLAVAQSELEAVAQTEPDMAVVEEDLLDFDAVENSYCIEVLSSESTDLDEDADRAFEKLGRVKEQIHVLEKDRRAPRLRLEFSQNENQLKLKIEEWLALQWAGRILEKVRSRFERTRQPATLTAASHYLNRLTAGKYANIWTPLGERRLMTDNQDGRTLKVEQLSGGTREQLFLSIRFALVDEFRRQGIELPMVLDDVIVNFDQQRAEAAVETLLELTARGHQILFFTCHAHLARLFESRGAKLIRLPENRPINEERKAG